MCPWRVDYPARVHLTTYPQYPEEMAAIAMPGDVLLQFIFDRSGQVDTSHVVELHATNSQFAHAVRVAMSQWSGETALLGAQAMPQWLTIDVRFHSEGCRGLSNPAVIATTALLCVAPPGKK
jgi:TonB family protein